MDGGFSYFGSIKVKESLKSGGTKEVPLQAGEELNECVLTSMSSVSHSSTMSQTSGVSGTLMVAAAVKRSSYLPSVTSLAIGICILDFLANFVWEAPK